jgi:hypothetical protein
MKKFLIALLVLGSFSIMAKDVCLITIEKDTSSYSVLIGDPENKSYAWTEPFKLDSFAPYFLSWATSSF